MDDFAILSIGRQFIEMAIRSEQLGQSLKKTQEELQKLMPKPEAPKES